MKLIKEQKGNALLLTVIAGIVITALSVASVQLVTAEQRYVYEKTKTLQSQYLAEAGLVKVKKYIEDNYLKKRYMDYDHIDEDLAEEKTIFQDIPLIYPDSNQTLAGNYTVSIKVLKENDVFLPDNAKFTVEGNQAKAVRFIRTTSIGTTPGSHPKTTTITAIYKVSGSPSKVFDYAYFINNWGWWYTSRILCYGNSRSNGSFDLSSYRPILHGKPIYEESDGHLFTGAETSGGLFAWNQINGNLSANSTQNEKHAGNRTSAVEQIVMPNLNNLAYYEKIAKEQHNTRDNNNNPMAYIKINGITHCDGVYGDNPGEKQHLYLEGTKEHPIEIKGVNVIRGDLIIRGYVKGQGTIYVGNNVYIPQRIIYKNYPKNYMPMKNGEYSAEKSDREAWRLSEKDKDLLGLFVKENIIIGNFKNQTWRERVGPWLVDEDNKSHEDSGEDCIPNTGDLNEGNNKWDVEYIVDAEGNKHPIPGSGEDIDGDGIDESRWIKNENEALQMFNFQANDLTSAHWGGNIPINITSYSQLCNWDTIQNNPVTSGSGTTTDISQIDGVLYTNHFIAGHMVSPTSVSFNGAFICRNEAVIFNIKNYIIMCHDDRLTNETGERFNMVLPKTWNPLERISVKIH
ncbi:MAG: hypothetical protein KBC30_02970 [Planctomycetes bacterium]|nr:hypothetical protein [Planctomycetota bacterium]